MVRARLLSGAAVSLAAMAWAGPTALAYSSAAPLLRMSRHVVGEGAALTFDDGPHPVGTPATLEALAQLDLTATFFLVGEQAERFPHEAAAIREAGHEIANHGYRHINHLYRNPLGIAADIERGADVIGRVTGIRPTLYRPPQGAVTLLTRTATLAGDWPIVLWSTWGRDWRAQASAVSVTDDVGSRLAPGGVILLHDADHYSAPGCFRSTVAALPRIAQIAEARGIALGPIGGQGQLAG